MRTAKSCGSGAAVLALSPGGRKFLPDDGGKRAVLRGEHEVSRKTIAQGRPECCRCPVCSCAVLLAQIARESGRSSIPETPMIEPISRGVLDAPPSRGMTGHYFAVVVGWVVSLRSTHPTGVAM